MMTKKILFLLGSANMSGGTYVILQHALYMQNMGYDVSIALVFMKPDELIAIKNSSTCWHDAIKKLNFIHISESINYKFDIAIFTWWATVFHLEQVKSEHYVYFVQSIESRFYPEHQTFMHDLVHRTYKIGLPFITEATWIQQFLTQHFNTPCALVKNGLLKSIYSTTGDAFADKSIHGLRVLVEGPIEAAFKNVPRTIQLCKQANVGEVWLLTSSPCQTYPGIDRVFSQIPTHEVAKVYRSCDVIVKLSYVEGMFGPPLEMFHCGGTAIVYDVTGHDEYIKHNYNALIAKTDDEAAVIHYLQTLNQDRKLLESLKQGALETALAWNDWDQSSQQFIDTIEKISSQPMSESKKISIQNNFIKLLREHIPVEVWNNNQQTTLMVTATPLYDSGYYVLYIPISNTLTQFKILLGHKYKKIRLLTLFLLKTQKSTGKIETIDFNSILTLNVEALTNTSSNEYDCVNETAAIQVGIKHEKLNFIEYEYQLQMEFNPVQMNSVEIFDIPGKTSRLLSS